MSASRSIRLLLCGALAAVVPLSACTARSAAPAVPAPVSAGALQLVAFDSCEQLLTDLRKAAAEAVGPYGFPGDAGSVTARGARTALDPAAEKAPSLSGTGNAFSGTNNHEADADEPDIVKTDGRRIVTVQGGVLRVVDAATRRQTGRLDLDVRGADANLLLAGDHALVLAGAGGPVDDRILPAGDRPQVLLVDLRGTPRVISRYAGEGALVDARQTGTVARVVLRSAPRIVFPRGPLPGGPFPGGPLPGGPLPGGSDDGDRVRANRAAVANAPLDAWLPGWSVTTGGTTDKGTVGCDRISRPAEYSGTSLVTVLTFDVAAPALGDGDPVAVVADADTVYSTRSSLYLASDQRWRLDIWPGRAAAPVPQRTEVYRFALRGTDRPAYAASGTVPGFLINQYALSDWDGHLRVAMTGDNASGISASAIRVLVQRGAELQQTGVVDGLGKGERIYSVRFIGPRSYVVTFRQTDPLYSVDLSDPARPVVTGELKITGYSAHLQPVGAGRLIGIGQETDAGGRTRGTQVSLFDVSDPANPRRIAQQHVDGGQSEAEWDPHALLWWPATGLLVVPVTDFDPRGEPGPRDSALALRVTDDGLTRVGTIAQPAVGGAAPTVRRSLVVGNVLWTLSDTGLQASGLSTMDRLSWLPNE